MGEVVDFVGRIRAPVTTPRDLSPGQQWTIRLLQQVEFGASELAYVMGSEAAADFLATLSVEVRAGAPPPRGPAA